MTITTARRQWQEDDVKIRKAVKSLLGWSGMTQEDLASHLGITQKTLRSRLKNPDEFKMSEIRVINYLAQLNDMTMKILT